MNFANKSVNLVNIFWTLEKGKNIFVNFFYQMSFYNDRKDAMAKPKNNTSCEELLRFGDISETGMGKKLQ